jgi:hypothetical protein
LAAKKLSLSALDVLPFSPKALDRQWVYWVPDHVSFDPRFRLFPEPAKVPIAVFTPSGQDILTALRRKELNKYADPFTRPKLDSCFLDESRFLLGHCEFLDNLVMRPVPRRDRPETFDKLRMPIGAGG